MGSYSKIYIHLIFGTKWRKPVMDKENQTQLYRYMAGILKKNQCLVLIINGVEDHLHLAFGMPPNLLLSELVKDIKLASSFYIKKEGLFPKFTYWQGGYGAFSFSELDKQRIVNYIRRQEEHHKRVSSRDEFIRLLREHGVAYEEEHI